MILKLLEGDADNGKVVAVPEAGKDSVLCPCRVVPLQGRLF